MLAIIKQSEQKQAKTEKDGIHTTKLVGHKLLWIYRVIYVYIKYDRLSTAMKQKKKMLAGFFLPSRHPLNGSFIPEK